MDFLAGIFTSVPILVVSGSIIVIVLSILILTKTKFSVGNFNITPGKDITETTMPTHETCPLYNEHMLMLGEAFESGIEYIEAEKPIHKRLRKMVSYKIHNLSIDFMYEGYHQVFHQIHGTDKNLVDSPDHNKIMSVINKCIEHSMEYTWSIIEENHIVDKKENGTWQAYRNSRIQESLSNTINYMINKIPKLQDVTDIEAVKNWYERNSHKFVSSAIDFWDIDIVPLLQELYNTQKDIKSKYFRK